MMTIKRLLGVLTVGLALMTLAVCGQKSTESIIKNELKDSYTGSSQLSAYESTTFRSGSDTLTFNKKDNTITTTSDDKIYFTVLPKDDCPDNVKEVLKTLDSELTNTDNFSIMISHHDKNPTKEQSEAVYQVALSDGGKTLRLIELRRNYSSDGGYYDFHGTAD